MRFNLSRLCAIMLAVKMGAKPSAPSGKIYKAAEGIVLGSDEWHPAALTLLAIAEAGDAKVVNSPGEMMRITSGYAHAGFPLLFSLLDELGEDHAQEV